MFALRAGLGLCSVWYLSGMVPSDNSDVSPRERPSDLIKLPRKDPGEFADFARAHPRAAARAFEAMPEDEQERLIAGARGKTRRDLILLSPDPQALVRALPAVDLLLTLKELGDDATDLLSLASLRQVRLFVDLDAWRGDRLDIDHVEEWLGLLHDSGEKFSEAVIGLDREVLVRWLRGRVRVWKAEADGSLPHEAPRTMTLDGVYHLEALRPNDDLSLVRAALMQVCSEHEKIYWQLLEGVIHELDSDLELWAFRWRESRLNDEGFPSFDDALPVYARLNPQRFRRQDFRKSVAPPIPAGDEGASPTSETLILRAARSDSLLARAWEAGRRQGGWGPLEEELARLLNRVLVADRMDWNSPSDLLALFERAAATLSLGLEREVAKSPEEDEVSCAAGLLREVRLDALFRLGFSLTLQARDAALRAAPDEDEDWTTLLESPLPETIAGARLKRPLLWTGLAGADEPVLREFRTQSEIETALRAMRLAGALRLLFEEVSKKAVRGSLGALDEERGPVRLQDLVITLFARDVLDGSPSLQPVPVGKLAALQQALFTASGPGCDAPGFREEIPGRFNAAFAAWVARLEARDRPDAESYLQECLERLRSEIGPLDPEQVDPRAVAALLMR